MRMPQPKYLEKEVLASSQVKQIVLLYNRAITLLKNILRADEEGDNLQRIKLKAESFGKVIDILTYLKASLNHERGGEIAQNLEQIYSVLIEELIRANIHGDQKPVVDGIEILQKLRDAFYEIGKNQG